MRMEQHVTKGGEWGEKVLQVQKMCVVGIKALKSGLGQSAELRPALSPQP